MFLPFCAIFAKFLIHYFTENWIQRWCARYGNEMVCIYFLLARCFFFCSIYLQKKLGNILNHKTYSKLSKNPKDIFPGRWRDLVAQNQTVNCALIYRSIWPFLRAFDAESLKLKSRGHRGRNSLVKWLVTGPVCQFLFYYPYSLQQFPESP